MSVVYPGKYKKDRVVPDGKRAAPVWSMTSGLNKEGLEYDKIKPPSPYPLNRRKPGVTLPVAGRIPYKIMRCKLPDIEKEAVKSLKDVEPFAAKKSKGKGKKGKKGKKK